MDERNDLCPTCGERFVSRCKCPRDNRACRHGHDWNWCHVHDRQAVGDGHGRDAFTCSCPSTSPPDSPPATPGA